MFESRKRHHHFSSENQKDKLEAASAWEGEFVLFKALSA